MVLRIFTAVSSWKEMASAAESRMRTWTGTATALSTIRIAHIAPAGTPIAAKFSA